MGSTVENINVKRLIRALASTELCIVDVEAKLLRHGLKYNRKRLIITIQSLGYNLPINREDRELPEYLKGCKVFR